MPKVIRLLMPIRSGKEVIPENAVLDAADDVADLLLGSDPKVAEETDAAERYPNVQFLTRVDEFPITGSEKFPIPEGSTLIVPPAMFQVEVDRRAQNRARAEGPIFIPAPAGKEASDEPVPQQPASRTGSRLTAQRAPTPGQQPQPGQAPPPGQQPTPTPTPGQQPQPGQTPAPDPAPRPGQAPRPGSAPQPGRTTERPEVVAAPVFPEAKAP